MSKDRDTNFKEHSIFLSEIAQHLLAGNNKILLVPGVKEIIALYLLIPYTTYDQLDAGMPSKMPKLDLAEEFIDGVSLRNLRDAICHSFVTVEESSKEKLGRIIIDDRAQMSRKAHDQQLKKSLNVSLEIPQTHKKLNELHSKIIDSIK